MNGISVATTVVISFHPVLLNIKTVYKKINLKFQIFITKVDQAYYINCFYTEKKRTVSQGLNVNMLTERSIYTKHEMPICRQDII